MTVFLYKGDAIAAETFKTKRTDPADLYGAGVYTTLHPGIRDNSGEHRDYGRQFVRKDKVFEDAMQYRRDFTSVQLARQIGGRPDREKIVEFVKGEVLKKYLTYQSQHNPVYVEKIATKRFHVWWEAIIKKFPISINFITQGTTVLKTEVNFRPDTKVPVRRNRFRLTRFEFTEQDFTSMYFLDENRKLDAEFIQQLLDEGLIEGYLPGSNITLHDLVSRHQFPLHKRIRFFRLLKAHYKGTPGIKYLGGPDDGPKHQCYVFWDAAMLEPYKKS